MSQPYRRIDLSARLVSWTLAALCLGCGEGLGAASGGATANPSTMALSSASAAPGLPDDRAEVPGYGPVWEAARASEDPAELARLAEVEGAATLMLGLDHPRFGGVARGALPFTRDAEVALGPLAARVRASATSAPADLGVILAILGRPPQLGERLDPEGERQASADLLAVARDPSRDRPIRAIAVSALRRLSERGLAVPGEIPTDLDD